MTNIVVYGKPRRFESYEYSFGSNVATTPEDTHREPVLKPKRYDDAVLHYFVKDDYAGLEYYTRAKGFDGDRDGLVFGLALKSDQDFNLTDTVENVLMPFWEDLAGALLDNNNKFCTDNILNTLRSTQWSADEIHTIQSTAKHTPIKQPNKELLLLVAPDVAEISKFEVQIKDFSDVYIADNSEIFKDPINNIVLQAANNQIFIITNDTITQLIETKQGGDGVKKKRATMWGSKKNGEGSHNGHSTSGNDDGVGFGNGHGNRNKTGYNLVKKALIVIVFIVPIICVILFFSGSFKSCSNPEFDGNGSGSGGETPSSEAVEQSKEAQETFVANSVQLQPLNAAIKHSWNLKPTPLYNGSAEQCLTQASEISLELLGAGTEFVTIEGTTLKVGTEKPTTDTKVTVIAKLNSTELGRQEYTIAKRATTPSNTTTPPTVESKIPKDVEGKPRTIDQFITDLESTLRKNASKATWVQNECQKIINGEYGKEYKNNSKAVNLRDEAKRKATAASSAF
jgi:hypothetical protein